MKSFEVRRHSASDQLVRAVADEWVRWMQTPVSDRPRQLVALGGGRVFGEFLQAAAREFQSQRVTLDRVDFFWADERCVPPDHPESNYRLAQNAFLAPLRVPASQVHRLRGEADPTAAARGGEAILRTASGAGSTAQPVLDLVFLGMGEDGHIASLFPDAPEEVNESCAVYLPVIGPKPPPQRLTLSYAALGSAREVWVLASGKGKVKAWNESVDTGGSTPLARLLKMRKNTVLFTDII